MMFATVAIVIAASYGDGYRVGEASNPGPGRCRFSFDEPEAEVDEHDMHDLPLFCQPPPPFQQPPSPVVTPPASEADEPLDEDELARVTSRHAPPQNVTSATASPTGPRLGSTEGKWFIPTSAFHGALAGWVFKSGTAGLGYYREEGTLVIRLEGLCAPPPPPRVISICDALDVRARQLQPIRDGGTVERRLYTLDRRARAAVDGAVPRRRPRAVPRRRRRGRRGRSAIPAGDGQPSVVADFRADDAWHRKLGLWAIETANPNSWDTARRYVEMSAADVLMIQELKLRDGDPTLAAQRAAAGMGWQLSAESCDVTDLGYASAGVGIAVRSHMGMSLPPVPMLHPSLKHRVHVRWVGSICKGGVFMATAYLWNGEGLSERNLDILQAVATVLASCGSIWLLAADFLVPRRALEVWVA